MANLDQLKRVTSLGERLAQNARVVDARYGYRSRWATADAWVHARHERSMSAADRFRRLELPTEALPLQADDAARPADSASPAKRVERLALRAGASRSPSARAVPARLSGAARVPSVELPEAVRSALLPALGHDVNRVRVHRLPNGAERTTGSTARSAPSAVAIGANVFVRPGRGNAQSVVGRALLAHEAAHAVWSLQSATAITRSTALGRTIEERAAQHAAHGASVRGPAPMRARAAANRVERESMLPASSPTASQTELDPCATASSVRAMFGHEESAARAPAAAESTSVDYESIKQAVLRDLMQQVRVDAERGG